MKTLYITAGLTSLLIALFFTIMSMIDAPLGGEPYTILSLTDRQKAKAVLANQKAVKLIKDRKKNANAPKKQQKNPSYFNKSNTDVTKNAVTIKGEAKPQKTAINHLKPAKLPHKKAADNQLEYIGKIGLPPAPVPELIEKTKFGMLPRISNDGRRPLDVYARPATKNKQNQASEKYISIVITGLGLSQPKTENAIEKLPPEVTLSFNPYSNHLKKWTKRARGVGHELILEIPMEPYDYPDNDPGPHTLLSNLSDKINIDRLNWLMSRMVGYVGVTNLLGGKFNGEESALYPIMREIKNRGLLYMDGNPEITDAAYQISQDIKLDYLQSTITIDKIITKQAIDDALKRLEKAAETHGQAIGIASALPLTIQRLSEWATSLKKRGITLIPLTQNISSRQS